MTNADILAILKKDLDIVGTSRDDLLQNLITLANSAIETEGIVLSNPLTTEEGMLVEMYAAYLYRRRKDSYASTFKDSMVAMPRSLRYQLNNLLIKQKGGTNV